MTCGECEYFGDYDKQILGPWEPRPGTNGRFFTTPFLGFDESAGAICAYPRTGTKSRVYGKTPACYRFKPRTWTRPENCYNCMRCHGRMDDGSFLCDGWPFYRKEGIEPCQNGKALFDETIRLF